MDTIVSRPQWVKVWHCTTALNCTMHWTKVIIDSEDDYLIVVSGSDDGSVPVRCQAITRANAHELPIRIGPLETN